MESKVKCLLIRASFISKVTYNIASKVRTRHIVKPSGLEIVWPIEYFDIEVISYLS